MLGTIKSAPKVDTCSLVCSTPTYITNDPRKYMEDYSPLLPMAFSLDFLYFQYRIFKGGFHDTFQTLPPTNQIHSFSLLSLYSMSVFFLSSLLIQTFAFH